MLLLLSLSILSIPLFLLAKRIGLSALSPVCALIATYALIFVAGSAIYDPTYKGGAARFDVSAEESYSLQIETTWLLFAFAVGAWISSGRTQRQSLKAKRSLAVRFRQLSTIQAQAAICVGVTTILLVVWGNGATAIYWRTEYLPEANRLAKILGHSLLPVGVVALGAASTTKNFLLRFVSFIIFIVAVVLTLALATRLFCLVPILFFVGALMTDSDRKSLRIGFATAILLAPIMMIFPLTERGMQEQGISMIPELVTRVTTLDQDETAHSLLNNIFISQPIAIASATADVENNLKYVITGVNPLPGFLTDWKSEQRRINEYTPFSAIGDLVRAGMVVTMLYYFVIGLYFGVVDRRLADASKASPALFALLALAYLFIVTTLQYPLRNASRMIYYMLLIELLSIGGQNILTTLRRLRAKAGFRQLVDQQSLGASESPAFGVARR